MKKISLCSLHIPLDVVELTFTGSRSRSCLKNKIYPLKKQHNIKVRTERDSNPECPGLKSSTLTITPQKTAHLLNITRLTIARLVSDNVSKIRNII